MSSYFPPEQNLAIFDPSVFKKNSDALTIQEADTRYCRFPTAQGTMNFTNMNVFGDASFNLDVSVAGTLTAGTLNINNLAVDSIDVGTGGIDCSGNVLVVDYTGSQQNTEMVVFANVATTGKLGIVMNPTPANYNPIVRGDDTIMSFGESNGAFANFCIAPWSQTACGMRVTKENLLIGSGGTTTGGVPINPTENIFFNGLTNTTTIKSNNLQVDGNLTMINANATSRQFTGSYLNMTDINTNLAGLQLYQGGPTTIFDNNALVSGAFLFACNNSIGNQITPFEIFSTSVNSNINLLINGVGNYLQFPDGSQQTTAFTPAGSQKTYSVEYTSNALFNLPINTIGIEIRCVGRGGNAGNSSDGNGGTYASGGTGGAGSTVFSNGIIPLIEGQNIDININNTAGSGSVIVSTNSIQLCRAFNGNNGGNASGSNNSGIGGAIQANGVGNTNFGTWTILAGNAGTSGISNNSFQSPAGVPTISPTSYISSPPYLPFSDTGRGSGQRYSANGGANCFPNATPIPQGGICIITYYLK